MLRYFIQVIENSIVTGILAAMLWAVAVGSGVRRGRRVLWGSAAGSLAALVIAVLRRTTALINRGFFNTWVLSSAIVLGILYILFLWEVPQRALRKGAPEKTGALPENGNTPLKAVFDWVTTLLPAAILLYTLPVIFLYPTEFVLPGESVFSTDFLFCLIGFAAGVALAAIIAASMYRTAASASAKQLKIALTVALAVTMCNYAVIITQFLLARRIIPMAGWLFSLIIAGVNNSILFLYAVLALGLLLTALVFAAGLAAPVTGGNPAERRKVRAKLRLSRCRCVTVAAGFAVSVLSMTVVKMYTERGVELSPAEPMTVMGGEILIPVTRIEDGHLHRFVFAASDGTEVRFIVIKKNAAAYGVGLDACDICGPTGYYERKNEVICRLCDVVMNISTIGFKGGCNPVPLAYTLRSGSMVIETVNLENEKNRFK
jgi:uncharacterized membrane protein